MKGTQYETDPLKVLNQDIHDLNQNDDQVQILKKQ